MILAFGIFAIQSSTSNATQIESSIVSTRTEQMIPPCVVRIYPNPFEHEIQVDLSHVPENTSITVSDILGNVIFSSEKTKDENISLTKKLDMSGVSEGVYFLNISGDSWKKSYRIIKK
jgi:hypothetical protein